MRNETDPRSQHRPQDRTDRHRRETEDEREIRLGRELRHLMQDPRYMEGDPDYRTYVLRQYRRVYDDPKGEPAPLRIGRPQTFTDHIEPFQPGRERRLRLGTEGERTSAGRSARQTPPPTRPIPTGAVGAEASRPTRTTQISLADANRRSRETTSGPQRKASSLKDRPSITTTQIADTGLSGPSVARRRNVKGNMRDAVVKLASESDERQFPDDPELRERLQRTLDAADVMIEYWGGEGYDLFAEYFQRYINREGGTTELPWSMLEKYSFVPNAVSTIRGYYDEWLAGKREDTKVGSPFLSMPDGGTLRLGEPGYKSPVRWENEWYADEWTIPQTRLGEAFQNPHDTDFLAAFGSAEVVGYGDFTFVRRGNVIHVVGEVDMRFDETFDFEEEGVVGIVSQLTPGAPATNDREMGELADHGLAATFRTVSNRLWMVTGQIIFDDSGTVVVETILQWREVDSVDHVPNDSGDH